VIDLESIVKLDNIPIHDSKIGDVKIDYDKQEFFLSCILELDKQKRSVIISFAETIYSDISFYSPWGESYYIFEAKEFKNSELFDRLIGFEQDKLAYTHYQFILNSGDSINVIAKSFSVEAQLHSTN